MENEERIEDVENLFEKFYEFCLVDLQLTKTTAMDYIYALRKFFRWLGKKKIDSLTPEDLRKYLMLLKEGNHYTYANTLKALRRFFRDFLGLENLVKSFKFPQKRLELKKVPSKEEIRKFYEAIDDLEERAIFLLIASSGLRRNEALSLKLSDIDFEKRMIIPKHESKTKRSFITFYNEEAESLLKEWLEIRPKRTDKLFPMRTNKSHRIFMEARKKTGINITPQILREWFACEMGRLGVPDRYVDAFCGRVPRSILARHYTDFSPDKLKEIYDKANLKVLS
jgi:integrase